MDGTTATALASGSLVERDMLTIHGWDSEGDPQTWCFWTGESDVAITVQEVDGGTESRDFVGGAGLDVPPIVDAIGLDARGIDVSISHLHPDVEDMARGGRLRLATVEIHRAVFNPSTRALVSTPYLRFVGFIEGAQIETPAEGGEGVLVLSCTPDTLALTKINPALKSHEQQLLRSGDEFRQYGDTAGQVAFWWGRERSA